MTITDAALRALIQLTPQQEQAAKDWAAEDQLWTTQETVEFNLRTFARVILAAAGRSAETPTPPITWYPCTCGAEHDTPTCPFGFEAIPAAPAPEP